MRLLLIFLLAPVLASASFNVSRVDFFNLPRGLSDGSVLTLWFWHTDCDDGTDEQFVSIEFYDTVQPNEGDRALIRIDRAEPYSPVKSDTLLDGQWQNLVSHEMDISGFSWRNPSKAWWRVDVIKHDEFHLNVFFQGIWAGVRKFDKSLNNIKSVHINGCVDKDPRYLKSRFYYPNNNLAPMSVFQFADIFNGEPSSNLTKLASFPSFPIGARISMVASLKVPVESRRTPTLGFVSAAGVFMKILQDGEYTHHLFITAPNRYPKDYPKGITDAVHCVTYAMRPNGELVHLDLKRMSQNVVRLQVLYKFGTEEGVTCDLTLPMDASRGMDGPFDILSHQSALLFHISMMSK